MPRKLRPSFSVNAKTRDRVAYFVDYVSSKLSRTGVVEAAINEYLDVRGVPRDIPPAGRVRTDPPLEIRQVSDGPFYSGAGHTL